MEGKLFRQRLRENMAACQRGGLHKTEHVLTSPQQAEIIVGGKRLINFASNNYLGLADHSLIKAAVWQGISRRGFGLSSVRFICGTQDIHRQLERALASFVGQTDSVLYASCWAANLGLLDSFLGPDDAVFSDQLNHASLIDGVRLCKAQRFIWQHRDLADLELKLAAADKCQIKIIVTDGVFSMDGEYAPLADIANLARRYQALVAVDDSHATGLVGNRGQGSQERAGVSGRVDIITSTLGKALGGATGGFTATSRRLADYLRDFSRPYLFSNSLSPLVVAASLAAVELIKGAAGESLRRQLWENTRYVRDGLSRLGITTKGEEHPIVAIMLGEAKRAQQVALALRAKGVFAVAFSYPVVPLEQARVRLQISAVHKRRHLDRLLNVLEEILRR